MRIAASIAHAAHRPERRARYLELRMVLGAAGVPVFVEDQPGKPCEWSERQWHGALHVAREHDCSHVLLLNDDVVPCTGFVSVLERVIEARPRHLINLYNAHEYARDAQAKGLRWLTSHDGLIGNAYVMPRAALEEFLSWREAAVQPEWRGKLSEDQLVNLWAMARGTLVQHTVPALVDHDTSVPSCYPHNEKDGCRRPVVGPSSLMPTKWDTDALHVGRFFKGNHYGLIRWLNVPAFERYFAVAGDRIA